VSTEEELDALARNVGEALSGLEEAYARGFVSEADCHVIRGKLLMALVALADRLPSPVRPVDPLDLGGPTEPHAGE
jgi:hypothetical protein